MPTVYNQTVACRFGVELADLLANTYWTHFDAAVAWVRRSGMRHVLPALREFLRRKGAVRFVVGIDIENTSKEGLEDLLSLARYGSIHTFVNHNESANVTFHPKVYLFSNAEHARLIVASNNLTKSGLFTNTEAGLQVDAAVTDPVIVQMRAALDSWCDASENLAHELDDRFLAELEQRRYVSSEEALHRRRQSTARRAADGDRIPLTPLFGSKSVSAPPPPSGARSRAASRGRRPARRSAAPTSGVGVVLIVRPRLARGTQIQIPIRLKEGPFLRDVGEIVSDLHNITRPISAARPERGGGTVNTYKMELPEARDSAEPVMRIWRTAEDVVVYRVYDADSPEGRFLMQRLEEGRHTTPPLTTVTKPGDPDHATWYRFI